MEAPEYQAEKLLRDSSERYMCTVVSYRNESVCGRQGCTGWIFGSSKSLGVVPMLTFDNLDDTQCGGYMFSSGKQRSQY